MNKSNLFKIQNDDNVAVMLEHNQAIPFGHKVALCDMKKGDSIIKYGYLIGVLCDDVKRGEWVHSHNLKSNIPEQNDFVFSYAKEYSPAKKDFTFNGYLRTDGRAGVRNEIWIIPTVGCVNKTVQKLENIAQKIDLPDGVHSFCHPFGCSQLGDDQENTRKILSNLIKHPNAGGVLVVSLGCENSNADVIKSYLGDYDEDRIKFLVCQDVDDELAEGEKLLKEIFNSIKNDKRQSLPISKLVVGFKCGGSDSFSGITANPLCGDLNDELTDNGATTILTEIPEMFGAEQILLDRCNSKETFKKLNLVLQNFKDYFVSHNQPVGENPSPGNHDGGITTLEEKSLGCVQKGGKSIITDVLSYGESCTKNGLNILNGPGNDIVSTTNLASAGVNVILFTTGRGTPLGAPVPTIKISTNSDLANKKQNWIDFNAGVCLEDKSVENAKNDLLNLLISVANGENTKNEINDYRDISIFKDGVVL